LYGSKGALLLPRFASLSALTTTVPPTTEINGALAYADGKLYTCTGSAWVVADADTQYAAATADDLGLVKVGSSLSIADGVLSVHKKCDGAIVYKAAWDYNVNAAPYYFPGDSARVATVADNTTDRTWSPNIAKTGAWSDGENLLDSYFKPVYADLCVYKENYKGTGTTNTRSDWMTAVNYCAGLVSADGASDWYLPNERELQSIYQALSGVGGSAINFNNLGIRGYIDNTAESMEDTVYWSSTEYSATYGLTFAFDSGGRYGNGKTFNGYVRCVRRL
jgi:hypothetical protein